MNSYAITGATYSSKTGYVTFTRRDPNFIVGSNSPSLGIDLPAYNGSYIAVAGTSGTTVVGNPLAAPLGMPQAISDPGAYVERRLNGRRDRSGDGGLWERHRLCRFRRSGPSAAPGPAASGLTP